MENSNPIHEAEWPKQKELLSFQTIGGNDTAEWLSTANQISQRLAAEFRTQEFETDFEVCKYPGMQDWEFLARGHGLEFIVILVLYGLQPTRWFVSLRDINHYSQPANPHAKALADPIIESTIKAWPGVSDLCWHADASTLRR